MESTVEVFELQPANHRDSYVDDSRYTHGIAAFERGDWEAAKASLQAVCDLDPARNYFLNFMAQHDFTPPLNWDGVVPLNSK